MSLKQNDSLSHEVKEYRIFNGEIIYPFIKIKYLIVGIQFVQFKKKFSKHFFLFNPLLNS